MNSIPTELLASKQGAKQKSRAIADALLSGTLKPVALLEVSPGLPDADLAIVMESLESATRVGPAMVNDQLFALLVRNVNHAAPRVQWEAARTIGNVAGQHAEQLGPAVEALLANVTSDGQVVRWATARALAAILRVRITDKGLRQRLSEIAADEQDEGVRRVYEKALRSKP